MEPNAFVAEVYRRMTLRTKESAGETTLKWDDFMNDPVSKIAAYQYKPYLPGQTHEKVFIIKEISFPCYLKGALNGPPVGLVSLAA